MPRSGRSILPPCQHRGDPLRLRPLATLDGAAVAAQQSTHQTTPYSHRSRRARHPNGDETTLALAPSVRRRQRTSPTQRRNRVVHRPQLKTLCLGVVTQRHAGSACPLQCFHRLSLLLRQRLVHRVPHFPQVHCPQSAHDGRTSFFKRLRRCCSTSRSRGCCPLVDSEQTAHSHTSCTSSSERRQRRLPTGRPYRSA